MLGIEDNYVTATQQPSGGPASARRGGKNRPKRVALGKGPSAGARAVDVTGTWLTV